MADYKPDFPYLGEQIIINSGRVILNSKDDSVFLFGKKAIGLASKADPTLFDKKTLEHNLKLKESAENALLALKYPGALSKTATQKLLNDVIANSDEVERDLKAINKGILQSLIHFNKNTPEYKTVYSDYKELNRLYNELDAEKMALKDAIAKKDVAKIMEQLRKISATENAINALENKTKMDMTMLYMKQNYFIDDYDYSIGRPKNIYIIE
jgi:hypothetical protein